LPPLGVKQRRKQVAEGIFFFGYFLLDKQKKVPRQSGETDKLKTKFRMDAASSAA